MIKLLDVLNELNIQPKSKLGSGETFTTYPSKINSNQVIKVSNYNQPSDFQEHLYIFTKYPKYFPEIYKETNKYIIIEKLNLEPVKEYINNLKTLAKEKLIINNPNLPEKIKNYFIEFPHMQGDKMFHFNPLDNIKYFNSNNKKELDTFNWLIRQDSQLFEITKKLYNLYNKVDNILYKEGFNEVDFHENNIGTDIKGNFKMLDF